MLICIGAGFVLVMIIASLQGHPQLRPVDFESGDIIAPVETPPPSQTEQPLAELEPSPDNPVLAVIAMIVGILIAVVIALLLLRLAIRLIRALWERRALQRKDAMTPDLAHVAAPVPESVIDAPIVRDAISGALDAIDESPVPADAIVSAWVGLEESAGRAGQERGMAETPGEFTLRIIGRRGEIAAETTALLALYERVRFGGHVATEDDRADARALLTRIRRGWE